MKRTLCLIICIATLVTLLSGCGSFFAEPEVKIESIESELLDDGQTKIIINYVDTTMKPLEFLIPAGKAGDKGEEGVGIEVAHEHIGEATEITITYTDGRDPLKFSIPDGLYAVSTSQAQYDEFGMYVVLTYNDGTTSGPIYIPEPIKGDKGDTGNGITNTAIDYNYVDEFGEEFILVTIKYSDPKMNDSEIKIPKTIGIDSVEAGLAENGEDYAITVHFTDGTSSEPMIFTRPTKWYYGSTRPSSAIGRDGDYYFDEVNKNIYRMIDGDWGDPIISLGESNKKVTVTFNVNDSADAPATMMGEYTYRFYPGECFASNNYYNGNIPIPTRDGYIFDGWYAKITVDPLVNSRFTDLTTVSSSITLYARWIEK